MRKLLGTPPSSPTDQVTKSYVDSSFVAKDADVINVKDHGVIGSGSVDDSAAINAVLAGGNKSVYFPAGTYRCDSYIRVQHDTLIQLHPDAVIQNNLSSGNCLLMNGELGNSTYATGYDGDGNITIRGGTFDGALRTAMPANNEAMAFGHARDIRIENVNFINNRQDHFIEFNACADVRVLNCTFDNTTVTSPGTRESINIDYSFSSGFPHFGGYDATPCTDVLIQGCTFTNGDVSVGSHSEPTAGGHTNIRFVDNYVSTMSASGVMPRYWEQAVITGNTINGSATYGIRASGMIRSIVANNIINGTCSNSGIYIVDDGAFVTSDSVIADNIITNVTGNGIVAQGLLTKVTGNRVDCTGTYGIYALELHSSTVSDNTVTGVHDTAIRVNRMSNGMVTNNYLSGYDNVGILIGDASDTGTSFDVLISSNRLRGTTPTNSIVIGTSSTRTMMFGNRYRDGGAISDSGTTTLTEANNTDSSNAWLTWSPTLTGFSANPTNVNYRYKQVGKTVTIAINQAANGTSNSTGFTITLPVQAANISNMEWGSTIPLIVNNGSVPSTPGLATIASNGTVVTLYTNTAGAGWTGSGGKRIIGLVMTYEAA